MTDVEGSKDAGAHLIYPRTSRAAIQAGLPVIVKGEGARVYDRDGKAYLDLVSGWTRPVLVGCGRREIPQAMNTPLEFAPPLVITRDEIDEAMRILNRCLIEEVRSLAL